MIDAIIKAVESNQVESLAIVGLIVFFIWLFKEQRFQYIESRKENTDKTREVLIVYAELFTELKDYREIEFEKIEKIYQRAIPYLPTESLKKFIHFKKERNEESYSELKIDIETEIFRLKGLQKDPISYRHDNYLNSFEFLIYSSRQDTFIKPLIYTIMFVYFLVLGALVLLALSIKGITFQVVLVLFMKTLSILILILGILSVAEFIKRKKFMHTLKNWSINIILFIMILVFSFQKAWYFDTISVLLAVFYIIYLYKIGRKRY